MELCDHGRNRPASRRDAGRSIRSRIAKTMSADLPAAEEADGRHRRTIGALSTVGISFVLAIVHRRRGSGWSLDRWLGHQSLVVLPLLRVRPGRRRAQRLPDGGEVPEVSGTRPARLSRRRAQRLRHRRGDDGRGAVRAAAAAAGARRCRRRLLVGFSYWTLKSGVTALAALVARTPDAGLKTRGERRARNRETGAAVRFTRSSGVRYDCAFAPAPMGAAGGCILGCGGSFAGGGSPRDQE